jgi:hypothetical protein
VRFAVIGDFGNASSSERAVADMVQSWDPDFVATTGDNNYLGSYESAICPFYGEYVPACGAPVNRFFPAIGNHDSGQQFFGVPNTYDVVRGDVHLFVIDNIRGINDQAQKRLASGRPRGVDRGVSVRHDALSALQLRADLRIDRGGAEALRTVGRRRRARRSRAHLRTTTGWIDPILRQRRRRCRLV